MGGFFYEHFEPRQEVCGLVKLVKSNFLKFVLELPTENRQEFGGFCYDRFASRQEVFGVCEVRLEQPF